MELPPPQPPRRSVVGTGERVRARWQSQLSQIGEQLVGRGVALGGRDAQAAADDRIERRAGQLPRQRGRPSFHHPREHQRRVRSERDARRSRAPRRRRRRRRYRCARRPRRRSAVPAPCSRACPAPFPASVSRVTVGTVGVGDAREAEVEDLDVAVRAPDHVLRLQIAVDDAARVGGREP